jgi:hypothetical protein
MNATQKEGRLAMLVLTIDVDAATDQEFGNVDSIVLARNMKG